MELLALDLEILGARDWGGRGLLMCLPMVSKIHPECMQSIPNTFHHKQGNASYQLETWVRKEDRNGGAETEMEETEGLAKHIEPGQTPHQQ